MAEREAGKEEEGHALRSIRKRRDAGGREGGRNGRKKAKKRKAMAMPRLFFSLILLIIILPLSVGLSRVYLSLALFRRTSIPL